MKQEFSLTDIAKLLNGRLRGDGSVSISGIASLESATANDISWVSHVRFKGQVENSKAGALLVNDSIGETDKPSIVCGNVDEAVAIILDKFAPAIPAPEVGIHETAVVSDAAIIGKNVAIGPYVIIGAHSRIGDNSILYPGVHIGEESSLGTDCRLWNNVVIRERCHIGDRVTIHPNAVIGADGFGYYFNNGQHQKIPHPGGVSIGNDVEIGACSCVDRSKTGNTTIANGTKIDNLVQVAHNASIGANVLLCAQVGVAGSSRLGNYVVLGGQVGIRDNIVLNDGVMVAACSCVPQDVEAGAKLAGIPAIDSRQFLREKMSLKKIPSLSAQVKSLIKRVEELEAATNNKPDD